jgi:hypothetical protein
MLNPLSAGVVAGAGTLAPFDSADMNYVGDQISEFFGGPNSIEPNSNQ